MYYSYSKYEESVIDAFNAQKYLISMHSSLIIDPLKECNAIKKSLERLLTVNSMPNIDLIVNISDTIIFTLMPFVEIYHEELTGYNTPIAPSWPILNPQPAHVYWGDRCREILCDYYGSPDEMLGLVEKNVEPSCNPRKNWTMAEWQDQLSEYLTEINNIIYFIKAILTEISRVQIKKNKDYVNKHSETAFKLGLFDKTPRFMG